MTQVHKESGIKTTFVRISDFRAQIAESVFPEGEIRYHML